jgi:hypothetical protein
MKRHIWMLPVKALMGAFVLFAASLGHAQYENPSVVKVNIPFAFHVGAQTLPAGEYSLKSVQQNVVALRDQNGHTLANIIANSVESNTSASSKVVFHSYSGEYFLAQVWSSGASNGLEIAKSHEEIEMAKNSSAGEQSVMAHR